MARRIAVVDSMPSILRSFAVQSSSSLTVIFETSTRVGLIALANDSEVLAQDTLAESMKHARDLTRKLAGLFEKVSRQPREVCRVVVSLGPGSYTALRVGVMAAKMFAYVNSVPLHGVPTFRAIAELVQGEGALVEVVGDALQGEIYAQRFERRGETVLPMTPLSILHRDVWQSRLEPGTIITGPGITLFPSGLAGVVFQNPIMAQCPTAESLLRVALSDPSTMVDAWNVEPIYLRGSSAEEKRKQAHTPTVK